ncbi:hypothetical protein AVEN_273228-1 [Araneus ventricosus]|uniref:Uncharacterized protein n=1 Tax=Araneus ventricosus TaxID=182803 RepID=A0A4Y2III2_ARAVE|nr:hypothetical protein AVEN_273228-1 [Araneus ventricosus]
MVSISVKVGVDRIMLPSGEAQQLAPAAFMEGKSPYSTTAPTANHGMRSKQQPYLFCKKVALCKQPLASWGPNPELPMLNMGPFG